MKKTITYDVNEKTVEKKHSVRHYKDKFIKISQKIYLFFRVSGTNVFFLEKVSALYRFKRLI